MPGLMKSSVTIFQPIIQANADGSVTALTRRDVDFHMQHAWPGRNGLGPLYRQFPGETVEIGSEDLPLNFDSISYKEANRTIDLATQAYSLQNESVRRDPSTDNDGTAYEGKLMMKLYAKENTRLMQAIRNMPEETYNQLVAVRFSDGD